MFDILPVALGSCRTAFILLLCYAEAYDMDLQGEHIHHGYFLSPTDTKEQAQRQLIELLITRAECPSLPSEFINHDSPSPHNDSAHTTAVSSPIAPLTSSTPSTASSFTSSFLAISTPNTPLSDNEQVPRVQVLDVGCGIGGTSRYLAKEKGWDVTGVTISQVQVKMAYDLSYRICSSTGPPDHAELTEKDGVGSSRGTARPENPEIVELSGGSSQFIQLDAGFLHPHFPPSSFDIVWICEALSHLPDKPGFFHNAFTVLRPSVSSSSSGLSNPPIGRLVIADWTKAPNLTSEQHQADIIPIEKGMLLPPLASDKEYVEMARKEGFELVGEVLDISEKVSKTWYVDDDVAQ